MDSGICQFFRHGEVRLHITIHTPDAGQYADLLAVLQLPHRENEMPPTQPVAPATPVALYACIHDDADPVTVMNALRETATAHGWEVTTSAYDTGPLARPPADRLAWRTIAELLATGSVHGVVTPDRHHVDMDALSAHSAFAAYRLHAPSTHHYRATLPTNPALVREARHTLTACLASWHVPEETVDSAELILSELLTNAVIHTTCPDVTLDVTAHRYPHPELHLAVTDRSSALPHPPTASHSPSHAGHGRGLALVAALATAWGTTPSVDAKAKTVWARVAYFE